MARGADEGDLSSCSEPVEGYPSTVSAAPIHLLPQGEKEEVTFRQNKKGGPEATFHILDD